MGFASCVATGAWHNLNVDLRNDKPHKWGLRVVLRRGNVVGKRPFFFFVVLRNRLKYVLLKDYAYPHRVCVLLQCVAECCRVLQCVAECCREID